MEMGERGISLTYYSQKKNGKIDEKSVGEKSNRRLEKGTSELRGHFGILLFTETDKLFL